jgi:hypothetical protein
MNVKLHIEHLEYINKLPAVRSHLPWPFIKGGASEPNVFTKEVSITDPPTFLEIQSKPLE